MKAGGAALALALAAMAAAPAYAAGGDMSVATFLGKAEALMAKGPFALLSKDVKVLRAEGEAASDVYHARLARERAQGNPSSCPPRKPKEPSNSEFLKHLRSYAPAVRAVTKMNVAMGDWYIRTYPCK
jgi:hypothetical protein